MPVSPGRHGADFFLSLKGIIMTVTIEKSGPLAVPLAELKAFLGISLSSEDAALTDLIRSASEAAERFLNQTLVARTVTEVRSASACWGRLALGPVRVISNVEEVPMTGAAVALPVGAYSVDIKGDGGGWVRILDPAVRGRIRVTYQAGIAATTDEVPDAIQHAIIRLAGEWHAKREEAKGGLPQPILALLRPWRRIQLA